MYHEERVVDGVLCWRSLPNDNWTPFTAKELTAMLQESKRELEHSNRQLRQYDF